ncbi:peptidoglycan D,D-transpeptidase FtsI family protein [Pseudalkalibacillus caeni]|uniref:Penicillin-binding protein 2 n=1 Tax=Exobacillus caeni TaxID=2574798 RepID=A0A5R9FEK1_9BACL|nr:penicillin-binding transpeptidase domain-containing protein [Pseudalkalibacillus caeni]TLS39303.1 penicillin-binding protein 2 [Pseudalkalibacillus caeni]
MRKRKRVYHVLVLFVIGILIMIGRLIQLQLLSTESFSKHEINLIEASVNQRTQTYTINDGRGNIVARNGEFLDGNTQRSLVLFPFLKERDWPINELAQIIDISSGEIKKELQKHEKPFSFTNDLSAEQVEAVNNLKIPGVYAVLENVEQETAFAQHLIGSTRLNPDEVKRRYPEKYEKGAVTKNTKVGITGLQKAFDPFLISEGESKLLYHADRQGNPLFGMEVKYFSPSDPFFPVKVKTTIDKTIQQMAEDAVDRTGMKHGGLVLLDAKTNDLLAMVSRPTFDEDSPLGVGSANEMVKGHFPGSVFKTLVAAGALENNLLDENRKFDCNQGVYRQKEGNRKLGELNGKASFAQSCNAAFTELGEELVKKNPDAFEELAQMLGIEGLVGWHSPVYHYSNFEQLPDEEQAVIFKNEQDKQVIKAIDQTSIGQLNVKLSPLSIANMMATIARSGERKQVRVVSDILYENNASFISFPEKDIRGKNLSPLTYAKLQEFLREVVKSGTGRSLASLPYQVAGKSGTAQHSGESNIYNQWFAGYFPADNPRYVMVVVDLKQEESDRRAYQIYEEMVKGLYSFNVGT